MRKFLIGVFGTGALLMMMFASCNSVQPITHTSTGFTEKDEVLITHNAQFSQIGVVGVGARIIDQERANAFQTRMAERERRLRSIPGINIRPMSEAMGNGFVATLENGILFGHDSFELRPDALRTLNELAVVLRDMDNVRVHVVGHTDNTGGRAHNQQLSEFRAEAVSQYLHVMGGVSNITNKGVGFDQPIASNETEAGRQLNRRVEIEIGF